MNHHPSSSGVRHGASRSAVSPVHAVPPVASAHHRRPAPSSSQPLFHDHDHSHAPALDHHQIVNASLRNHLNVFQAQASRVAQVRPETKTETSAPGIVGLTSPTWTSPPAVATMRTNTHDMRLPTTPLNGGHLVSSHPQWPPTMSWSGLGQMGSHQPSFGTIPGAPTTSPTSDPFYTIIDPNTPPPHPPGTPQQIASDFLSSMTGGYNGSFNPDFPLQSLDPWPGASNTAEGLFGNELGDFIGDNGEFSASFGYPDHHDLDDSAMSSVDDSVSSVATSRSEMSPTPALSHQYRGSTVSTDLPSTPSLQAISFPDTQNPLEIIQYNPDSDAGGKSCRKRAFDDAPKSIVSQTLKHVSLEDENGDVQATMTTFGQRLKKRAVFSEQKRLETALARKEGVCYRCKASKRKCDLAQKQSPYESCKLCTRTKIYKNIKQMPCFNSDLKNILFFRSRPASTEPFFTTRELLFALEEVSRLRVRIETLKLTQRIGDHKLIVYASEFDPLPGDVVSYKWTDAQGHHREMMMPHVSLTFIEKVAMHIRQYIDQAKRDYLKTYLVGLRSQDNLARMTIIAAMDYAKTREGSLVDIALDLWAICRMIEIPWERCGDDTLGVSQVKDPTNPHHGKFPIPPIMDTQLDQVVIQYILAPLREKLIEKLEASIAPPKPETWFETYLAVFILLNHIEQLAHHSASHAKLHTLPTMYSNVPFLEGVFHTAKTVLSRFHFVCNGSAPFRLDWTSKAATSMARLEPKQVEFMRRSQEIIQETENDVLSLRTSHQYGRCLYWCHQLFFDNWDSSFPVQVKVY